MAKAYIFLAEGFEITEAMAPVDILMRGGIDVETVSISEELCVSSSNGIVVQADATLAETDFSDADLLILPGGMPGTENLVKCLPLHDVLLEQDARGGLIGAICAAPWVLGVAGLLRGKTATCYPGFEPYLDGAEITGEQTTVCDNIITGKGPGASLAFGYELLEQLTGWKATNKVKASMQYILP